MNTQNTDIKEYKPNPMPTKQAEQLLEYLFDLQTNTVSVEEIRQNSGVDNMLINAFLYEFERKGLIICEKRGLFGAPLTYRIPGKSMIE